MVSHYDTNVTPDCGVEFLTEEPLQRIYELKQETDMLVVGGGKLLVLAVDTKKKMDERPATRQLLESIDNYVRSDRFAPEVTLDESFIASFMR